MGLRSMGRPGDKESGLARAPTVAVNGLQRNEVQDAQSGRATWRTMAVLAGYAGSGYNHGCVYPEVYVYQEAASQLFEKGNN